MRIKRPKSFSNGLGFSLLYLKPPSLLDLQTARCPSGEPQSAWGCSVVVQWGISPRSGKHAYRLVYSTSRQPWPRGDGDSRRTREPPSSPGHDRHMTRPRRLSVTATAPTTGPWARVAAAVERMRQRAPGAPDAPLGGGQRLTFNAH